jgi:thermitase
MAVPDKLLTTKTLAGRVLDSPEMLPRGDRCRVARPFPNRRPIGQSVAALLGWPGNCTSAVFGATEKPETEIVRQPEDSLVRLSKTLVVISLVMGAFTVRPSMQPASPDRFVAGDILVKFRPGANANERAEGHRAAGATQLVEIPRTGLQRVRVQVGNESAAIARYQRNPNVLYAERNIIRSIPMPSAHGGGSEVVPSDYYFDQQWALHNTGQGFNCIPWIFGELCLYGGMPDADIDAPEAWAIFEGSASVTVAVIDSGVDYTHPDLAANFDGGDDFVFSDGDPMDDHGHGTHVAGTIAAALNNTTGTPPEAEGVSGVAPNARIRAYKVCRSNGLCDDFAIQQAIARAITDGANVINMSLGETLYSQSLNDAVQDAWNAGLVIVAAAGNNGTTELFYPAALDHVISVAAFDENHRRASFSNYGNWVDISAPGNAILSTYPMVGCGSSTTPGDIGCYNWNSGTSMASPHVAGAAALVWSRSDVTSNGQVVDILLNSADGQGVSNVRLDSWTIHGGLNLHDALSYGLTNLPPDADAGPDQTVTDSDRDGTELVSLDGSASSDRDGTIVSYAWREGGTSIGVGATQTVALSVGVHTLILEVTDDGGGTATDIVVVTVNPANQVTVTASTAQATEAGPTNGVFTITRTGDTSVPLTVHYTVAGSALAGTDYTSLPGTVTIGTGSSTATVAVRPIDDSAVESDESVILALSANAAYSLGTPSGGTVTIVSDDLPSDLVVAALTAPAESGAGLVITVSDTTRNQGSGSGGASTTSFYLSLNSLLDAGDPLIGSRPVPALAPGATHSDDDTSVTIPADTVAGTYRIIAKADGPGELVESSESNNLRSAIVRIGPDLIVSALTVPASVPVGVPFLISDTTLNQGGGASGGSLTRIYLSLNSSLDASDQQLQSHTVNPLGVDATQVVNTNITLPPDTPGGQYYLLVVADANNVVAETADTNNTRAAILRVGPDLRVLTLTAPSTAVAGSQIAVTDLTRNEGQSGAAASTTAFYFSSDLSISPDDFALAPARAVPPLAAGASSTGTTTVMVPAATPGVWYVLAAADASNQIAEAYETNNTRSALVAIGPDLTVFSFSTPTTVVAGSSINVTDTVKNIGAEVSGGSTTRFYLSLNSSFDPTDIDLAVERVVPTLGVNATNTGTTTITIPTGLSGRYYLVFVADGNGQVAEARETNNTRVVSITINP